MIVSTISEKVDKSDVESISSETIKDESGLSLSRAYSVTSEPPVSYLYTFLFFLLKSITNRFDIQRHTRSRPAPRSASLGWLLSPLSQSLSSWVRPSSWPLTCKRGTVRHHILLLPQPARPRRTWVLVSSLSLSFFLSLSLSLSSLLSCVQTRAGWVRWKRKRKTVDLVFPLCSSFSLFCAWSTLLCRQSRFKVKHPLRGRR